MKKLAKNCTTRVPAGAYKLPQTMFDLLEDEGIVIPEDLKYFLYRATYDFECYFKKEDQHPQNTEKNSTDGKPNMYC